MAHLVNIFCVTLLPFPVFHPVPCPRSYVHLTFSSFTTTERRPCLVFLLFFFFSPFQFLNFICRKFIEFSKISFFIWTRNSIILVLEKRHCMSRVDDFLFNKLNMGYDASVYALCQVIIQGNFYNFINLYCIIQTNFMNFSQVICNIQE